MKKFTVNELLESFEHEINWEEMIVIYKALIAYSCGYPEVTKEEETALSNTIEYFFDNDDITSFVNPILLDYFEKEVNKTIDN